jgi:hypothetical protein
VTVRPLLLACALASLSAPFAAVPAVAAEAADAAHRQKALALAQTVQSQEIAIDSSMAVIDSQMVDAMMADPDVKKLEAAHPGAVRAMWEGAKPVMRQELVNSLPDLWQHLADVYASHLTDAQIDATTAFFRTATGHKFLLQMNKRVDVRPMVADATAGEGKIRQQTYENGASAAAIGAIGDMSDAERAEIARFLTTDAGRALGATAPDVTRTGLEWMNRTDSAAQARVGAAMKAALDRFLAQHR